MNLFKDKQFNKSLLNLVVPLAVQTFMLNLISASDALMLGAVSQELLSAVSLAGKVQFILSLFLAAITIGTNILAAQYWGKKDKTAVENIFAIAIRYSLPIGMIFTLATAFFSVKIMSLFTNDEVIINSGAKYLYLVSLSYLFSSISQVFLCIMKNTGKAKLSTIIVAVCLSADAIMNAIMIFGLFGCPKMEISGAAISTTIAKFAEMLWAVIALQKNSGVKLKISFLIHINKLLHKDFKKYTMPVLGNELVWGVGFTMYSVIMGHLSSDAVAANSVAEIAKNLAICFCLGLGNAGGILVGNELGSGKIDRAKEYGAKLCRMAIMFGFMSSLILLCLTPAILKISNLTQTAKEYLIYMIVVCCINIVGNSVNVMAISGIFCAGGDSKFGLVCDCVVMWCIAVPLGLISAFVLHLPVAVVYLIINLDELLKLPGVYLHYKKYLWAKDLTFKDKPNLLCETGK